EEDFERRGLGSREQVPAGGDHARPVRAERVGEEDLRVGARLGDPGRRQARDRPGELGADGGKRRGGTHQPAACKASACCWVTSASTMASMSPSRIRSSWWRVRFTRWSVTRFGGKV